MPKNMKQKSEREKMVGIKKNIQFTFEIRLKFTNALRIANPNRCHGKVPKLVWGY